MKYLIAGLGNAGDEYVNTRHNIGFDILDALSDDLGGKFEDGRHTFITEVRFKRSLLVLIKPTTFVNLSGKAVRYWQRKLKIPVENILVCSDDISLPFGKVRIKDSVGDGGHNGLASIMQMLETNQFARLRFGIDNNYPKGFQSQYVLSQWDSKEQKELSKAIGEAAEAVKCFAVEGVNSAMNRYN